MDVYQGKGWTITTNKENMVITVTDTKNRHTMFKYLPNNLLRKFIQTYKDITINTFITKVDALSNFEVDGRGWIAGFNGTDLVILHHTGKGTLFTTQSQKIKKQVKKLLSDNETSYYDTIIGKVGKLFNG